MRGVAILTEARSGSEWLGSLTNNTGRMGKSAEWLGVPDLGFLPASLDELLDAVIEKGATPNDRFAVKLFARHLRWAQELYGGDFLQALRERHQVELIFLERRDRLRQAVSYARAIMTGRWKSNSVRTTGAESYDFAAIYRAYFYIERGYAFWHAYLRLMGLEHQHFFYEDLLADPKPFLDAMASLQGVAFEGDFKTELNIQRDGRTEEWMRRFQEEAQQSGLVLGLIDAPAPRTFENMRRFLKKEPLKGRIQVL